jgi:hypothetical protein
MRPEVEELLGEWGCLQPPSQSARAIVVLDKIKAEIAHMIQLKAVIGEITPLFRKRTLMEDFLSVHRTVWILEGKSI